MEQFLSSLVHHDPIAVHSLDLMGAARFAVEFCSSSPSPEVALAIRVVVDLVGDEGVRLWVRCVVRVGFVRLLAALTRYRRR
ncbi:hypothetical protein OIE69_42725 [Actinacidiphila glaucinigra]|uniref:hypothetical protein n=1 Tax=Actinacidiphila glaucinigra TaxID=235986 RepID=UPI002DDC021E|nr:hypothetical protein [Actinacidiphila glaucinigra]WSD65109.1 hypothetical protein OIE69_42725 [Actinacidiphila glaucinigra]